MPCPGMSKSSQAATTATTLATSAVGGNGCHILCIGKCKLTRVGEDLICAHLAYAMAVVHADASDSLHRSCKRAIDVHVCQGLATLSTSGAHMSSTAVQSVVVPQSLKHHGDHSPMRPIFMPARARARSALWAPGPGVLVLLPPVARSLMCRALMPSSWCAEQIVQYKQLLKRVVHTKEAVKALAGQWSHRLMVLVQQGNKRWHQTRC